LLCWGRSLNNWCKGLLPSPQVKIARASLAPEATVAASLLQTSPSSSSSLIKPSQDRGVVSRYTWACRRAGPGQQKARLKKLLPRSGPARLSGRVFLPRPGSSGQNIVGLSGHQTGPSLNLPNLLPKPGPSCQSGQISPPRPGPSGQNKRSSQAIFGPGRVGLGCPCSGLFPGPGAMPHRHPPPP
jgi:hypothetical protein